MSDVFSVAVYAVFVYGVCVCPVLVCLLLCDLVSGVDVLCWLCVSGCVSGVRFVVV